ncbi:hypothetical protein [Taklimakanibacter lacteus]|uniref:hypothetical protein n=1 Tax=Taklimakanibacter lacteus TaxID=2268456 RepID=UPI000E6728B8
MNMRILAFAGLALAASISSASALTVTNTDRTSHTFMLTPQGGKAEKVVLKSKATGTYDCSKGCEVRMSALKTKFDASVDKLSIKDGKFVRL